MLRTLDPQTDGGILSPPLVSNPTTKSFLHRIVAQQRGFNEQLAESEQHEMSSQ